jgi:hypothetical protein
MTDAATRVQGLIDEERSYETEEPSWEITIRIPQKAGQEFHDAVFHIVTELVGKYQEIESPRDWDATVSSIKGPLEVPVHLLEEALKE